MRINPNVTYNMDTAPRLKQSSESCLSQAEVVNNETNESKNKQDIALKCLTISRRIMAGDIVPQSDHRFLQKHDPEMYGRAILMRIPKAKPHKYKPLSREESDERTQGPDGTDGPAI